MMLTFDLWVHVLIYLYSNEYRTISLSDICKDLKIHFSTVSYLSSLLVKTRVIRLEPIDGRKNRIVLTENGKSIAKELYNINTMISKL